MKAKPCQTGLAKAPAFAAFAEKDRTMKSVSLIGSSKVIIARNMGGSVSFSSRFSCEGQVRKKERNAEKR